MRGGWRAPPTLTSQDWFYPHHWMYARKQRLLLCVLCEWVSGLGNQRMVVGTSLCSLVFSRHNGAATVRWILQQLHSKTVLAHIGTFPNKCTLKQPFHTTSAWKVWNFMKTHHSCLSGKNKLFDNIILTRTMHGILPKVVELTIYYKQQLRNITVLSHALFRNAQ